LFVIFVSDKHLNHDILNSNNHKVMKKPLLILTALLCGAFAVKAQQADYAKATVRYKFSHLRDTTQKDKPYTENMILFLGSTASAYKSYDRKMQDAMMRKQIADQVAEQKASGGGSMRFNINSKGPTTSTEWYMFPMQNKMARKEKLITPYLIEEPIPMIKWKISADTASFGTLHCQKATGHFAGRDYTAWFCPDLPFHAGPWKLNGLPGLIVEAYDTNKEVMFKFDGMDEVIKTDKPATTEPAAPAMPGPGIKMFGMEDANVDPNVIELPSDAVKTTDKEFKNLQEAMRKDPQAFMQSAMAGAGMNMRPAGGVVNGGPITTMRVNSAPGPVINNPLELPEKK
jgi:GLPGLI family protein